MPGLFLLLLAVFPGAGQSDGRRRRGLQRGPCGRFSPLPIPIPGTGKRALKRRRGPYMDGLKSGRPRPRFPLKIGNFSHFSVFAPIFPPKNRFFRFFSGYSRIFLGISHSRWKVAGFFVKVAGHSRWGFFHSRCPFFAIVAIVAGRKTFESLQENGSKSR